MKKSTGLLLLLTFFFMMMIVAGIIITVLVLTLQGTPPSLFSTNRVALVRVEGVIYDAESWIDQVETYAEDDSIPAIVVRVDSPGGAVGPSQDLYEAIHAARYEQGKIVVASFGSLAASGGYYVAAAANEIIAGEGTLTGSIGVYSKFLKADKLFEKIGIDYETVKAGEYKDFGSMERGLTENEREMMQHVIDDTYIQFVEVVKEGREDAFIKVLENWDENTTYEDYPLTPQLQNLCRQFQSAKQAHEREQNRLQRQFDTQQEGQKDEQDPDENNRDQIDADTPNPAEVPSATDPDTQASDTEEEPSIAETQEFVPKPFIPSRELLLAFARESAEGKIYTGRQAREIGLVDGFGNLDDAIDRAAKLAGFKGKVTVVEKKEPEMTLFDLLAQSVSFVSAKRSHSPLEYLFPY